MLELRTEQYTGPDETPLSQTGERFKNHGGGAHYDLITEYRRNHYRDPSDVRVLLGQLGLSIRRLPHSGKGWPDGYAIEAGYGITHIHVIEDIMMAENRFDVMGWEAKQLSKDKITIKPIVFDRGRSSVDRDPLTGYLGDHVSLCDVLESLY